MKRNGTIDYLKFIFSIIILLYHFGMYFLGGYIMVEGFFMISGYLMMTSLVRKADDGAPDGTARFVFHKYRAIFFPLLFSAISGALIYILLVYDYTAEQLLRQLPLILFEVFPTQNAGYIGFFTTGVSWYLSSMLLSIAILHPFAKKDPLKFAYTAAPVISILLYGLLCHRMGSLDVPNSWVQDLVNTGLLRGIAGISAGCVLYALVKRSSVRVTVSNRIFGTLAILLGFAYLVCIIMDTEQVRTVKDFVLVAVIFGILYVCLSDKSLFSLLPSGKVSKAFATVSTYIFMNHFAWCIYFHTEYAGSMRFRVLPYFLLCVAGSSVAVWLLSTLAEYFLKRIKEARRKKAESTEVLS